MKNDYFIKRDWLLQILALLGSGLSMIAIGILLTHFNNQPIFDWNGVTLNAIVAVFSTISKAMLVYALSECLGQAKWIWFSSQPRPVSDIEFIDNGSRGPLGSLQMLTKSVARSFLSMGAIMIILSVTIDPFVQLTVGQEDGWKFENKSTVQIAYAKRYSQQRFIYNSTSKIAVAHEADLRMTLAVLEGLFQSDSFISQQTQHSCPSGNCTWDAFTSLAICSGCNNVTDQIKKGDMAVLFPKHSLKSELVYYLPNYHIGFLDNHTVNHTYLMTALGSKFRSRSLSFTSVQALFWSMTIMNLTKDESQANNDSVSAIECGLWWCVNSYKSVVKNGILIETVQPAFSKLDPNSRPPILEPDDKEVFISPQAVSSSRTSLLNHSTPNQFPKWTDLRFGDGYNLSQASLYAIANLISDTFAIQENVVGCNAFITKSSDSSDDNKIYTPGAMEGLYNSQDLEATFATLAKSMTNNIRQNSDNHTVVNGKEERYAVLIRIRWWFLTPFIVLIVGGVIFLAMVLHKTHMFKLEYWGTNALPIIVMGGKMGSVFKADMKTITLEQNAKRQFIQFPSTPQPRRDFDRIDSLNRSENHEMESSSRISVAQSSPTDEMNIVSPSSSRTSVIHGSVSDAVSMISNEA